VKNCKQRHKYTLLLRFRVVAMEILLFIFYFKFSFSQEHSSWKYRKKEHNTAKREEGGEGCLLLFVSTFQYAHKKIYMKADVNENWRSQHFFSIHFFSHFQNVSPSLPFPFIFFVTFPLFSCLLFAHSARINFQLSCFEMEGVLSQLLFEFKSKQFSFKIYEFTNLMRLCVDKMEWTWMAR
jgi:hypothetical protein